MIFVIISLLENLVLLPISFTILRLAMSPDTAFWVSIGMCLVSIVASLTSKLKTNVYTYVGITFIVSFIFAVITVRPMSLVTLGIVAVCCFIFAGARSTEKGKGYSIQICSAALVWNIVLSIIKISTTYYIHVDYSNLAIVISTVCLIALLILKQMNSSRKFGKNNMRIGSTQRKNNQIFAIVAIVILIVVGFIGQVSNLYKYAISGIAKILGLFKLSGELPEIELKNEPAELTSNSSSPFIAVIYIVISIILIAVTIFIISNIIIYMSKRNKNPISRISEDGHVDEKESIFLKNLSDISKRLRKKFDSLFDRETPYNKLPNDIAKIRRLFRNYKNKAQKDGVQISKASTSKEICQDISEKAPETKPLNDILERCYDAARYGEIAPLPQELKQLEGKLRK